MKPDEIKETWANMRMFVAADDDLGTEDIRADLQSRGVDVDAFVNRLSGVVRKGIQHQWRLGADEERRRITELTPTIAEVIALSLEGLREWLKNAAEGVFGDKIKALAVPCYRNKDKAEMTEEELRSCVTDILSSLGPDSEKPNG